MSHSHHANEYLPLLPSQAWFLEHLSPTLLNRNRWNLHRILRLPADCDAMAAKTVATAVWRAHDALRATFSFRDGIWRQRISAHTTDAPFRSVDISHVPTSKRAAALGDVINQLHFSLNIETGPLVRFAYVRLGDAEPPRLIFLTHHLVCDRLSLSIITNDIDGAVCALGAGQGTRIPSGASYADSIHALNEYARSELMREELRFWTDQAWDDVVELPRDQPPYEGECVRQWTSLTVPMDLAGKGSQILPDGSNAGDERVILGVVADALTTWADGPVCVQVVHNGRSFVHSASGKSVLPGRVWRTVGWFATAGLAILPPRGGLDLAGYVKAVSASMDAAPNHGLGIGLLRWMSPATASYSAAVRKIWDTSALLFNYVGAPGRRNSGTFRSVSLSDDQVPPWYDPLENRLQMHVRVVVGEDRVVALLDYDAGIRSEGMVLNVARMLENSFHRFLGGQPGPWEA